MAPSGTGRGSPLTGARLSPPALCSVAMVPELYGGSGSPNEELETTRRKLKAARRRLRRAEARMLSTGDRALLEVLVAQVNSRKADLYHLQAELIAMVGMHRSQ
ncbi:MAG: hypothetical protein M3281_06815 [Chloroflexota bacterium]|nr:hypothetical protein [Chloroflexota bacterium]